MGLWRSRSHQGNPNCSKKKGAGAIKAKPKTETAKSGEKAGGKEKKPMTCSHCGKSGHSDENCYALHPEKRPRSLAARSDVVKTLQAELAELKKEMSAMASLGQVADTQPPVRGRGSSSPWMPTCMALPERLWLRLPLVLRPPHRWGHLLLRYWVLVVVLAIRGCQTI